MNNSRYSILIVDDDPDDRESIREAFLENKYHHEYIFLSTGEDLLNYLHEKNADALSTVILLDLNMPGMDGRDALKHIKNHNRFRHIPTIILTTSSSHSDRQASYALGANCFVTKPDTFTKLVDITDSIAKLWIA
ncbi:MAG TPA: response regulator [Chitinophagaceae bacterium]|nr:response regulator [Chitinophagaceae bacterium]